MKGISIIVCCYNSANRLPETIKHIACQIVPNELNWEVLIVNNNSNDNTGEIAKSEWTKYNCNALFKVINEPEPGLSYARKSGIIASQYKYAIFCDDDNWLESNFIQIAFNIMESKSDIGMLGGKSEAVCEICPPDWFDKYKDGYAIGVQAEISGDVSSRNYLWGAALVLRTDVLKTIYNLKINSILTDRKGNDLSSGGDSEISAWFLLAGFKLWYDEHLMFKHFIPKERLTKQYLDNLLKGFQNSYIVLHKYERTIYYHLQEPNFRSIVLDTSIDIMRLVVFTFNPKKKYFRNLVLGRLQLKFGLLFKLEEIYYTILKYRKKLITIRN